MGTFVVNVSGSFALGALVGSSAPARLPLWFQAAATVGSLARSRRSRRPSRSTARRRPGISPSRSRMRSEASQPAFSRCTPASCWPARCRHNPEGGSLRGQLLIASPALIDPNFRRTVVLVTEHTDEGAAGLVLNRPSLVAVAAAVPHSRSSSTTRAGLDRRPVQPEAVLVLGSSSTPTTPRCRSSSRSASPRSTSRRRSSRPRPAAAFRRLRGLGRRPARGGDRERGLDPRGGARRRCVHRRAGRAVARRAPPQGRDLRARRAHARRSVAQLATPIGEDVRQLRPREPVAVPGRDGAHLLQPSFPLLRLRDQEPARGRETGEIFPGSIP